MRERERAKVAEREGESISWERASEHGEYDMGWGGSRVNALWYKLKTSLSEWVKREREQKRVHIEFFIILFLDCVLYTRVYTYILYKK